MQPAIISQRNKNKNKQADSEIYLGWASLPARSFFLFFRCVSNHAAGVAIRDQTDVRTTHVPTSLLRIEGIPTAFPAIDYK
jgi:hypothetical protein